MADLLESAKVLAGEREALVRQLRDERERVKERLAAIEASLASLGAHDPPPPPSYRGDLIEELRKKYPNSKIGPYSDPFGPGRAAPNWGVGHGGSRT